MVGLSAHPDASLMLTFSKSRAACVTSATTTHFAYCIGNGRSDEIGSSSGSCHKRNCIFACESSSIVTHEYELAKYFRFSFGSTFVALTESLNEKSF
jgi:hypothetical protein